MARKPRVHFARVFYHVMWGNQKQSIFKKLPKELHQDPAVLSRGLGKLEEMLASKPELRGVMETLYDSLRTGRGARDR